MTITYELDSNLTNFSELVLAVLEQLMKIGQEIVSGVLRQRDTELLMERDASRFRCKGFRATSVKTRLGVIARVRGREGGKWEASCLSSGRGDEHRRHRIDREGALPTGGDAGVYDFLPERGGDFHKNLRGERERKGNLEHRTGVGGDGIGARGTIRGTGGAKRRKRNNRRANPVRGKRRGLAETGRSTERIRK